MPQTGTDLRRIRRLPQGMETLVPCSKCFTFGGLTVLNAEHFEQHVLRAARAYRA